MEYSRIIHLKDRNARARLKWAMERVTDMSLMSMLIRLFNLPKNARITKQYLIVTVCGSDWMYRKLRAFLEAKRSWRTVTNRFEVEGPGLKTSPYMFGSYFEIDLRGLAGKLPHCRVPLKFSDVLVSNKERFTVVETDAAPRAVATVSTENQEISTRNGKKPPEDLGAYLDRCARIVANGGKEEWWR